MDKAIEGRSLSEAEVKELIKNVDENTINLQLLEDYFAFTKNKNPKYSPQDFFVLPAHTVFNETAETTTVGRFVFNSLILTVNLGKYIRYINKPLDSDTIEDLENAVAKLFLEKKITAQENRDFLDKINWISYSLSRFINSSLSAEFVMTNPKIKAKKEYLLEKNKTEIQNGNIAAVTSIEKELLSDAKEIFKTNPSMQIYNSGCRGSFGNNYKNTSIIRGVIKDFVDPSKSFISTTSLDEGIKPSEYKFYADISNAGTYGKAINTKDGGYQGKIMSQSFQSIVLDDEGSDCGTKLFYKFLLTPSQYKICKYRYIKDPTTGKLIELNDDNKDKFLNKYVEMRSPLYCKNDKICNKCAGNYFYKMNIKNIGLLTNGIAGVLLNKSMKAFHDSTVKLTEINIEDYISD